MSHMEQAMQDQIEGSIHLQNAICDDALEVYRQTHTMPIDMKMQRDELLETLQSSEKKIVAMFDAISKGCGEAFAKNDPDVLKIRAAIAKATGT